MYESNTCYLVLNSVGYHWKKKVYDTEYLEYTPYFRGIRMENTLVCIKIIIQ